MGKDIKAAVQLHPVYHVWMRFSMDREAVYGKSSDMSQVPCMFGGDSGRGHILTMEPHWQKLEGHHEGAMKGKDSQELQR